MLACEYVEGLPTAILTDRMKSVLVTMDGSTPHWNGQFADFLTAIGMVARVCRAYTPQTKGKVERSIGVVKQSFWPGVRFTDLDDLNRQARAWCDRRNQRVHATTRVRPLSLVLFGLGNIVGYGTTLAKIFMGIALPLAVAALLLVFFNRG